MNRDPLDDLHSRLSAGDTAAAGQVFRAYEPYLRMVVRRLLPDPMRNQFDSSDVVQSVWADLVLGFRDQRWQFDSSAHLRAFLVKVTRNRFLDYARQFQRHASHEQPLTDSSGVGYYSKDATPSEEVSAGELWDAMLALCPPQHRPILELRRQGVSLREIAQHTGLHESSVRRVIYELAHALAKHRTHEPLSEH